MTTVKDINYYLVHVLARQPTSRLLFLVAETLIYLSLTPESGKNGDVGNEEVLANNVTVELLQTLNLSKRAKGSLPKRGS